MPCRAELAEKPALNSAANLQ